MKNLHALCLGGTIAAVGVTVVGCLMMRTVAGFESPTMVAPAEPVSAEEEPPFSIGEEPLHLGYVRLGEIFVTEIELRNEGDESFTLADIATGCSCTKIEWMNPVVPAGGSTTLILEHDPYPYVHGWTKQIRIQTHERPKHWFRAVIRAHCGYAVQLNRGAGPLVDRPTGTITAESVDDIPFRVTSVHGLTPTLQGVDSADGEARTNYLIDYDLTAMGQPGEFGAAFVIETDHPGAEMIALRMHPKVRRSFMADPPGWRVEDPYVLAGRLPDDGGWVERTFTLKRTRVEEGEIPELGVEMMSLHGTAEPRLEAEIVSVMKDPEVRERGEFEVTVRFRAKADAPVGFAEEVLVLSHAAHFTQLCVYGRIGDPEG